MKNGKSLVALFFVYNPPENRHFEPQNEGLEDEHPFGSCDFSGSMLVLGGISENHILLDWKLCFFECGTLV